MHNETEGQGRVTELPDDYHLARELRAMLQTAGVTRAELFEESATRHPLTWHDLRATAATWWAVRGDSAPQIQDRLGHTDYTMTQHYVRQAAVLRQGFGEVFPALPKCILRGANRSANRSMVAQLPETTVEPRGIEPRSARYPACPHSRA